MRDQGRVIRKPARFPESPSPRPEFTLMPKSIKDKIVLITGASSGFGADAARLFAREGCIVLLAARRVDRLTAIAQEIQSAGGQAFAIPLDIAEPSQVDEVVRTVLDNFGHIDILVNNAGYGRLDWLENLHPARDIENQIAVNLTGLIRATRTVLPSMLERRSGVIINMCSMAGWIAAPLYSIYSATKFGVRGFTEALRREVSPFGIQVCGIYPGGATTEFGLHTGNHPTKKLFKKISFINMSSEYVARRIVGLAKRPRRTLILPWWYRLVLLFALNFPGLVDWILKVGFVQQSHRFEKKEQ